MDCFDVMTSIILIILIKGYGDWNVLFLCDPNVLRFVTFCSTFVDDKATYKNVSIEGGKRFRLIGMLFGVENRQSSDMGEHEPRGMNHGNIFHTQGLI